MLNKFSKAIIDSQVSEEKKNCLDVQNNSTCVTQDKRRKKK